MAMRKSIAYSPSRRLTSTPSRSKGRGAGEWGAPEGEERQVFSK
jgi:hypothetical protein